MSKIKYDEYGKAICPKCGGAELFGRYTVELAEILIRDNYWDRDHNNPDGAPPTVDLANLGWQAEEINTDDITWIDITCPVCDYELSGEDLDSLLNGDNGED